MLCPTRQQNESQDFSWLSSLTNSNIIPHYLYSFTARWNAYNESQTDEAIEASMNLLDF